MDVVVAAAQAGGSSASNRPRAAWALGTVCDGLLQAHARSSTVVEGVVATHADRLVDAASRLTDDSDDKVRAKRGLVRGQKQKAMVG